MSVTLRRKKSKSRAKWFDDAEMHALKLENARLRARIGSLVESLEQAQYRIDMFARTMPEIEKIIETLRPRLALGIEGNIAKRIIADALLKEKVLRDEQSRGFYVPYRGYDVEPRSRQESE